MISRCSNNCYLGFSFGCVDSPVVSFLGSTSKHLEDLRHPSAASRRHLGSHLSLAPSLQRGYSRRVPWASRSRAGLVLVRTISRSSSSSRKVVSLCVLSLLGLIVPVWFSPIARPFQTVLLKKISALTSDTMNSPEYSCLASTSLSITQDPTNNAEMLPMLGDVPLCLDGSGVASSLVGNKNNEFVDTCFRSLLILSHDSIYSKRWKCEPKQPSRNCDGYHASRETNPTFYHRRKQHKWGRNLPSYRASWTIGW